MKKIIGILGVAVFSVAMFMNTNQANAECVVNHIPQLNTGHCLTLSTFCNFDNWENVPVCDPFSH